MTTPADDMRVPDLGCANANCPQYEQGICTSPDPEVCAGTSDGRLKPCPDRLLPEEG